MAKNGGKKPFDIIVDEILAKLEEGVAPWQMPWTSAFPTNYVSKKKYSGMNVLTLAVKGYGSPYWITFIQCRELGESIKAGEHATKICKAGTYEVDDENGDPKKVPYLKYYNVFNIEQTSIELPDEEDVVEDIPDCEEIVKGISPPPAIEHNGERAFYRPSADFIGLPHKNQFNSKEEFYSTLFHEIGHWTGHETRLDREGLRDINFGSEKYSKEELIGEMFSAFMCGIAGIENHTIDNSAAYIGNWLKVLKNERKWILSAASKAQKAVDFIIGEKTNGGEEG